MVYQPSELIVDSSLLSHSTARNGTMASLIVVTDARHYRDDMFIAEHFEQHVIDSLSAIGKRCVSILMSYLKETQKRSLAHITQIRIYESKQYMILDPFTRRNLELVETVRERAKKGSLLWLLDKTVTSMGARLLRRWIDKPLMNKRDIDSRLEAVNVLYNQLIVREEMRQQLKEVYDLERWGKNLFWQCECKRFVSIEASLQQVPSYYILVRIQNRKHLVRLVQSIDDCSDVMEWIEEAIVDEPPVSMKDGGIIKPWISMII